MVMMQQVLVLLVGTILACTAPAAAQLDERKLVDLTYPFDERTVYWPTNKPFQWEKTAWGMTAGGYWYASANFSTSEHGGTHIDAPIHFGKGRSTVDEIPVQRLVGPAVVVDVTQAVVRDRDYRLTVEDLKAWETRHGRIPDGAIVLLYTGWGRYWPDQVRYLGSETPGNPKTLHFPGFSKEAGEVLGKERRGQGAGMKTPVHQHRTSRPST